MTVSSTNNKASYSANGSTTTFAYNFTITAASELKVFIRSATGAETLKTLTTHYTLTNVGVSGGGNVVFVTSPTDYTPANGETVVVQRVVPLTQATDYVENDPFPAATHEAALDKLTFVAHQLQEELDRSIKLSVTNTMTSTEFTSSATDRASKVLAFDSSGELSVTTELGTYKGDWAASTAYVIRDLVKDTSTGNIFFVNTAHTSSGSQPLTSNANSAKYSLIVDAASATTSASAAATSAQLADDYAVKVSGAVTGTDYSSKAWAVGGTGVTTTSSRGAAKEWATTTGGQVDTSEYSSKEYAVGTTATSSKSYALKTDGAVTGSDYSSKAWATGGTGVTTSSSGGAAKEWATTTGGAVDTSEFSAKEYSTGTTVGTGSSKQWALGGGSFVQGTAVAGGEYSAKYHAAAASTSASSASTSAGNASTSAGTASTKATEASDSATAAASSQVAAAASAAAAATSYDSFDDRYLGVFSSDRTQDNDGNALVAGALYFSSSSNTMKVYDGSSWIAATSAGTTSLLVFKYVATNGQTTFTGSDANSATLTYTVGNIIVTVNGVVLDASDMTATNGTSIVLTACDTSDEVVIYSFKSFEVSGALSLSNGGTVAGNTTFNGTFTVNNDATITSTDSDSARDPSLILYRNSPSPAANDSIGEVAFRSRNDNSQDVEYGRILGKHGAITDGSENGKIFFQVMNQGTLAERLVFRGNEKTRFSNADVELSTGVDLVFEGATANANETTLTVTDPTADRTITLPDATGTVALQNASIDMNGTELILDADADTSITADTDDQIDFKTGGSDRMSIDSSGRVGIGLTPSDYTEHSDDLVIGGSSGNKGITIVGAANGYSILSLNRSTNTTTTPNGAFEYNHTDNQMFIKANGLNSIQINSDGTVQKPYQSAFSVQANQQNNLAINATTTVQFANEIFDQNADFDHTNYTFQAPVTGKYMLNVNLRMDNVQYAHTYMYMTLYTSNRVYEAIIDLDRANSNNNDWDYVFLPINVLADMDASDTAYVTMTIPNAGSASSDIVGSQKTTFSGYLAC